MTAEEQAIQREAQPNVHKGHDENQTSQPK